MRNEQNPITMEWMVQTPPAFHTFGELLAIKEGDKLAEMSDCIPAILEARKDPLSTLHSERLLFLVAAFTVCISR